jgi:hypothetical protein
LGQFSAQRVALWYKISRKKLYFSGPNKKKRKNRDNFLPKGRPCGKKIDRIFNMSISSVSYFLIIIKDIKSFIKNKLVLMLTKFTTALCDKGPKVGTCPRETFLREIKKSKTL